MSVVPLTLTISLCLVFTFVLFFLREHSRRRFSGAESEALMPLADETPRVAGNASETPAARGAKSCGCGGHGHSHGHAHDDDHAPSHDHAHDSARGHSCKGNGSCGSCSRRDKRRAATAAIVADYYVKKAAREAAASDTPRT